MTLESGKTPYRLRKEIAKKTVGAGDTASVQKSGSVYVPAFDQVGTTWNLLGSGGTVASYYVYDAFGQERERSETVSERYRYGGKRLARDVDDYLPMYHFATRNYLAPLGRFAERDLETLEVRNAYAYAQGNPLLYVDPTGLQCEPVPPNGGHAGWLHRRAL